MSAYLAFALGILLGYMAQRWNAQPTPVISRNISILKDGAILADNPLSNAEIDEAIAAFDAIRPQA